MEELLRVGVISSTHGIRGEVKVFPTTDDINRFSKLKNVILDTGKEKIKLEVENVKFFKQFAILKFKGYDDINQIEKYKGKDLLVTREDAVPLEKDEYFICDLIGCTGINEDGMVVGTLTDVMQTGANDVFVFQRENGKEVLVPYIDQCVTNVNLDEKKIALALLPGMMEE